MLDIGVNVASEADVRILSNYRERIEEEEGRRKQEGRNGGHHFLYCLQGGWFPGTICGGVQLTISVLCRG
jgi:hypothetical protein